jgi:hypothetical protein
MIPKLEGSAPGRGDLQEYGEDRGVNRGAVPRALAAAAEPAPVPLQQSSLVDDDRESSPTRAEILERALSRHSLQASTGFREVEGQGKGYIEMSSRHRNPIHIRPGKSPR